MSPEVSGESSPLGESFLANFTLIRPLPGVCSSVFDEVLAGAEGLAAIFAYLRLLAGVNAYMNFHVLPANEFTAYLARYLALARVGPHVFLVTVAVKSFELANLAGELLPGFRPAVNLHMSLEVNPIPKGFLAYFANARLVVRVNAHVRLKGCFQVKTLVAYFAKFGKLFVVSSDMYFQIIL